MLTRLVNGERIVLSAEEEAAVRAEWAEADAAPPPPPPRDLTAEIDSLLSRVGELETRVLLVERV